MWLVWALICTSPMWSIVSTAALAVAAGYGGKGVAVPMMLAALGVLASILGTFFVKTEEDASQKNLLKALRTGTYISAALVVAAAYAASVFCFRTTWYLRGHTIGLAAGVLIGAVTEYYTSDTYNPPESWQRPAGQEGPQSSSAVFPWACCPRWLLWLLWAYRS